MPSKSPIILLTGPTAGIGKATAKALAPGAGKLILLGRNPKKLDALVSELSATVSLDHLDTVVADLSEPTSVEKAVQEIQAQYDHIDVLINNAGGMYSERKENSAGHEYTFALNHLGPQHLTIRLLPLLKASGHGRIVNVSSALHTSGKINFDDLMLTEGYSAMKAYAQAKLATVMFTKELAERLKNDPVTANALHPGVVATNFMDNMPGWLKPLTSLAKLFMISPEKGAETSVYLATSDEEKTVSGEYFVKNRPEKASPAADDRADAQKLWQMSETLIREALG